MNIKDIRAIVTKLNGGMDNATDEQIMTVWGSYSHSRQTQLLGKQEPVRKGIVKDDISH